MVTYDSNGPVGPNRGGGRTAASLHQPQDDHRDHVARGDVVSIAERLDGTYVADRGGEYGEVHGWFYPDGDRDPPLPTADPGAPA